MFFTNPSPLSLSLPVQSPSCSSHSLSQSSHSLPSPCSLYILTNLSPSPGDSRLSTTLATPLFLCLSSTPYSLALSLLLTPVSTLSTLIPLSGSSVLIFCGSRPLSLPFFSGLSSTPYSRACLSFSSLHTLSPLSQGPSRRRFLRRIPPFPAGKKQLSVRPFRRRSIRLSVRS